MEKPSTLFTGVFGAFAISCGAMVLIPYSQFGGLQPQYKWEEGQSQPTEVYPLDVSQEGKSVYQSNGCFYCHTQQIRDEQNGLDIERGWGPRRTIARDYLYEEVPLLGSTRMGPDFTNYGTKEWRNEPADDIKKPAKRDASWIYLHLYSPRTIVRDSKCPPYRFLFEKKKIDGAPSPLALPVPVEKGYQILPTREVEHLAQYLLNLDRTPAVDELKVEVKPEAKAEAKP